MCKSKSDNILLLVLLLHNLIRRSCMSVAEKGLELFREASRDGDGDGGAGGDDSGTCTDRDVSGGGSLNDFKSRHGPSASTSAGLALAQSRVSDMLTGGKEKFRHLVETDGYEAAHTWLQNKVGDICSFLAKYEAETSGSKTLQMKEELEYLKKQLLFLSRAGGPPPVPEIVKGEEHFICRKVPADNSCLFHCFDALFGKTSKSRSQEGAQSWRRRCASFVSSKKTELELVYGSNFVQNYGKEILSRSTWGGAVEIDIVSKLCRSKMKLFDLLNKNELTFECPGATSMSFLILVDGNHYDYLAYSDGVHDQTLFSIHDAAALRRARRFVVQLVRLGGSGAHPWRIDGVLTEAPILRQTSWQ